MYYRILYLCIVFHLEVRPKIRKRGVKEECFIKIYRSMRTYDVCFNSDTDSNSMGFYDSYDYCLNWIQIHNGTDHSYFADYKGGTVSIFCNETEEEVYEERVR